MADFATAVKEILSNFDVDSTTGCWIYKGGIDTIVGYGRVMIDGKRYHTHRLVAFRYHGLNLDNPLQFACHTRDCSSRACINPMHVYVGDNKSNQLDVVLDKCKKGHDLTEDNIVLNRRPNGKYHRLCRICHNERCRRNRKLHKDNVLNIDRKVG